MWSFFEKILDLFNFDINITGSTLAIFITGIFLIIIAVILFYRRYLNKHAAQNLTEKYKNKKWNSPLEAYDKYPDVNVFEHSGDFFKFGLLLATGLILLFFSWTQYEKQMVSLDVDYVLDEEIEMEPPQTKEQKPPPPPPPPPVIQEVPDEVIEEEEQPVFVDQSVDEETVVEEPEVEEAPPPPPPPPKKKAPEEIFRIVEDMPRFPGCEGKATKAERVQCSQTKLLTFINKNIKYPPIAQESGVEGTVVVQFTVEKNGSVRDIKVVRDIGAGCGDEAKRVVKKMADQFKWTPGKQRGRPVRVRFTLPVRFKLQ